MSFMFRVRKETESDYGSESDSKNYVKTYNPVHLSAFDGHTLSEEEVLEWLHFSIDTHYIKSWYKNGEGYFVLMHDSDVFVKLEWEF